MKRWLFLIVAALLFSGCAAEPEETSPATEVTAKATIITEATEPPEPTGFYDPDSMVEIATSGAVQVFPLNRSNCSRVTSMGDDLLLFSGTGNTTLTKLTDSELLVSETAQLSCNLDPDSPAIQISGKSVTYYDEERQELVFLDASLEELRRFAMPDSIIGAPALTADRQTVYYCTADALRAIDLETELDKLLKEMSYSCRTLSGLYCDDTVLACCAVDDQGTPLTLYLSTLTGETLYQTEDTISLWTAQDQYFAIHYDGAYPELITGSAPENEILLDHDSRLDTAAPILSNGIAVLSTISDDDKTTRLDCISLENGTITASVVIPGCEPIRSIQASPDGSHIWFLRYDSGYDCDTLCRWDPAQSAVEDPESHLAQRYTAEKPDLEGLDRCAKTAAALSEAHGVELLIWKDALSCPPDNGALTAEYQVPLIERSLAQLEKALSCYPEGFLAQAASGTDSGILKICLVRSTGENHTALQYWTDDSVCIALCPADGLEQNFHHQLFYILENRVMSTCTAYDTWDSLNPKDFTYDLNHEAAAAREDIQWIEGETRAFIDFHSMSFPREDRAQIMEYAVTAGNRSCFESETMQKKLERLCLGIRKAFDLEDSEETFRWEQYLKEPFED